MDPQEINEDAIDTEALQAQIDMSMSFAQNLVSSWIKPNKLPKKSVKKDVEGELKELMRRPARLGVGAPIPEAQSLSREAARLKGQLLGKGNKRPREEDEAKGDKKQESDDEESRAGAFKKKAKIDPFDVVYGKKKKKLKDIAVSETSKLLSTASSSQGKVRETVFGDEMSVDAPILGEPFTSNSPGKLSKKQKKKLLKLLRESTPDDQMDVDAVDATLSARLPSPPRVNVNTLKEIPTTPKILSEASLPTSALTDVSLITTPLLTPRKPLPASLLKTPLLNLEGSPSEDDSDGDANASTPASSPKKKRKRRKKKKHASVECASTSKPLAEV
ncbi:hypothetical protein BDQ12DRAFT_709417 [Crucibulum laeve]|uniref:Uncharacterized protein n=1 Tax=Crucibulum laeve TaxID=68775 RepID=A0A5C3MGD7_9AGAR|nr:hypothetical protein BDQ12DRAFT_709417 [Crucibulum laeve]